MAKKRKYPKKSNILIKMKEVGRKPSREEIHEMTNRGFEEGYKTRLVTQVGYSRQYAENYDRIFKKEKNA